MAVSSTFDECIAEIEQRFSQFPDKRVGTNRFIKMKEVGLSAFAVFFSQCGSFLEYQNLMQNREGHNNAQSLFNISHIPSENHIRCLLDEVAPSEVFPLFNTFLNKAAEKGQLNRFRYLTNQFLMALDGLHYFSSSKISCDHCSRQAHKNGTSTYSHSMMSATLVHPDRREVLPVIPAFIEPQDGHAKQDCERQACKRWLLGVGSTYAKWGVTLLGDDLYCCDSICRLALKQAFHFIFTCKPDSHTTLFEWVDCLEKGAHLAQYVKTVRPKKGKKEKQRWQFRYANRVPIRDGKDALLVNWAEVEVVNEQGKRIYYNTFATDHVITNTNVYELARAARTRWKTENEHNNTLKNHGYHLEHNFGHGKRHLAALLATLILLSFLVHTLLQLLDERYQAIRENFSRQSFFNQLRTLLRYLFFASWSTLMEMMLNACGPPAGRQKAS